MGGLGRRLLVPTNGRSIRGHVKGRQGWPRAGLGVIAGLVGYPSSSIGRRDGQDRLLSVCRRGVCSRGEVSGSQLRAHG